MKNIKTLAGFTLKDAEARADIEVLKNKTASLEEAITDLPSGGGSNNGANSKVFEFKFEGELSEDGDTLTLNEANASLVDELFAYIKNNLADISGIHFYASTLPTDMSIPVTYFGGSFVAINLQGSFIASFMPPIEPVHIILQPSSTDKPASFWMSDASFMNYITNEGGTVIVSLRGSSGGGGSSGGLSIKQITFTDRPSLIAWHNEQYQKGATYLSARAVMSSQGYASLFNDFEIGESIFGFYKTLISNDENSLYTSVTKVVCDDIATSLLLNRTARYSNDGVELGSDTSQTLSDEYWTALGLSVTVYYIE